MIKMKLSIGGPKKDSEPQRFRSLIFLRLRERKPTPRHCGNALATPGES